MQWDEIPPWRDKKIGFNKIKREKDNLHISDYSINGWIKLFTIRLVLAESFAAGK
jgi:hypothetical protein